MPDQTEEILQRLRADLLRLNETLEAASDVELTVDLKVHELRTVGRRSPIIKVSGSASRSRIELDERL